MRFPFPFAAPFRRLAPALASTALLAALAIPGSAPAERHPSWSRSPALPGGFCSTDLDCAMGSSCEARRIPCPGDPDSSCSERACVSSASLSSDSSAPRAVPGL